jgi:hypothetical protein
MLNNKDNNNDVNNYHRLEDKDIDFKRLVFEILVLEHILSDITKRIQSLQDYQNNRDL